MSATQSDQSDLVKITMINSGAAWQTKVNNNTKINKLISSALSHFLSSGTNSNSRSARYGAVLVRTREVLPDKKSVGELGVKDNGT